MLFIDNQWLGDGFVFALHRSPVRLASVIAVSDQTAILAQTEQCTVRTILEHVADNICGIRLTEFHAERREIPEHAVLDKRVK